MLRRTRPTPDGDTSRVSTSQLRRVRLRAALAVPITAASLWLLVYSGPADNVTLDTLQYAHQTLLRLGEPESVAYREASSWYCAHQRDPKQRPGRTAEGCLRTIGNPGALPYTAKPFRAIFEARPGWVCLGAPLVAVMGLSGLILLTFLCGVAAGVLVYAAVRDLGGSRLAGLASVIALYALPSGHWLTQAVPEGLVLAALTAAAIGAHRLVAGGKAGAVLFVAGLSAVYLTKSANGIAATLCLGAAALVALPFSRAGHRRRLLGLSALGGIPAAGWLALAQLLHYVGLQEHLQDLATWHFTKPATADPWWLLWHRNRVFGLPYLRELVTAPWWLLLLVLAGVGLLRRSAHAAHLWLAVGISGALVCVAHPVVSNWPRLLIPVWLPVSVGIALLERQRRAGTEGATPNRRASRAATETPAEEILEH